MTDIIINLFIKNNEDTENPNVRQSYGVVSGFVGIFCNIVLFIIKLIAGVLTSSIAVTTDAFNNLSDAGSSIVTLLGFKMSSKPADKEHPFGHGRIEYLSGLVVSLVIMLMGVELLKSSYSKIISPQSISFNMISVFIIIFSIAVKLWMYFFNKKMGSKINSTALKATALDSFSDVAATSTVLVGILVNTYFNINIDGYIGCLVALFILFTGFTTAKDTLSPLIGEAPDESFIKAIHDDVISYEGIIGVHDMIVHNYGPGRTLVSLHAEVPCDVNIMDIHDTIDNIERSLKEKFNCDVVIHMDPIVIDDDLTNLIHEKITSIIKNLHPSITIHDFRIVSGPTHTNLIFDINVPLKLNMGDKKITDEIDRMVKVLDPTYNTIINVDKAY